METTGSKIPPPSAIAPYFGLRRHNPGEVIERGSLPSDSKPSRFHYMNKGDAKGKMNL